VIPAGTAFVADMSAHIRKYIAGKLSGNDPVWADLTVNPRPCTQCKSNGIFTDNLVKCSMLNHHILKIHS
jgi:hypothetical protein